MRAARREEGAVLVEFALVLFPLLLLVAGFLQFGLAMNAKMNATQLTAEAARFAAVQQNPGGSTLSLADYIQSQGDTNFIQTAKVCVSYPVNAATSTSGRVGDPVKVTLGPLNYSLLPIVGGSIGSPAVTSVPVTSEATMRLEAVPAGLVPAGCST
jgi:Flp pilus assembly protein TadG